MDIITYALTKKKIEEAIEKIGGLKILNKGVINTTEDNVQDTATQYINTEYGRDPQNWDALIITLTDKNDDKILYIYSDTSEIWINSGMNQVDLSDYYTKTESDNKFLKIAEPNKDGQVYIQSSTATDSIDTTMEFSDKAVSSHCTMPIRTIGEFEHLTESTAPTWEVNKYYSYVGAEGGYYYYLTKEKPDNWDTKWKEYYQIKNGKTVGRLKANEPVEDTDLTTKKYVDTENTKKLDKIANTTGVHKIYQEFDGSTSLLNAVNAADANTIPFRSAATRNFKIGDLTDSSDGSLCANKNYVDTKQTITDNTLQTTNKTVVGAINEILEKTRDYVTIIVNAAKAKSENPLTFELTDEDNALIKNDRNIFINFDATSLGVGASMFIKSKSNVEHEYLFVNNIAKYNSSSHVVSNSTANVIVYNDETKIGVYTTLNLLNKNDLFQLEFLYDRDEQEISCNKTFEEVQTAFSTTHNKNIIATLKIVSQESSPEIETLNIYYNDAVPDYIFTNHTGSITITWYLPEEGGISISIGESYSQRLLTKQNKTDNLLTTESKNITGAINEVNSIAKGAQKAFSSNSYSDLCDELNLASQDLYNIGQSIYIKTLNVPDLWINKVETTSVSYTYTTDEQFLIDLRNSEEPLQIGYYQLSELETDKVDLTNIVKTINLTQAEFDALTTYTPNTNYQIIDDEV